MSSVPQAFIEGNEIAIKYVVKIVISSWTVLINIPVRKMHTLLLPLKIEKEADQKQWRFFLQLKNNTEIIKVNDVQLLSTTSLFAQDKQQWRHAITAPNTTAWINSICVALLLIYEVLHLI